VEKGGVDQIESREKSNYYVRHRKNGNKKEEVHPL